MQKQREHWGSQLGFILAAAGSAIGLGTLWKFPYMTAQNGGGIFVLVYIACTFLVGIPLFIAELVLGRRAQRGAVGIFQSLSHNSTFWKGVGWLGVASSFVIMTYYSVMAGWGLNYVLMSLNQFYVGKSPEEIIQIFEILNRSGDITLFWQIMFIILTLAVVYPGVRQGIEYWSRFMMYALLLILIGLFVYCITLEGFRPAIDFLFSTDASRLKPSGCLEALGLSFFTLSLGQGIMLTYGSYMRREDDIPKTGIVIGVMIVIVALLVALIIFPIMHTFKIPMEVGFGLVFQTLPILFAKLPGALLISVAFFTLFVFTALTSAIALVEVVSANFMDLLGWSRKKAVLIVGLFSFIFGIPSALSGTNTLFGHWQLIYNKSFFDTMDSVVSVWMIPIGGLFTVLFAAWKLDVSILKEEFNEGTVMKWMWGPWLFFLRWIAPIIIIMILLQTADVVNFDNLFSSSLSSSVK